MKAGAKSSTRAAVGSPGSRRGGSATPPSPTAPDVADTSAGHGTPPSPRVPRVAIYHAPIADISQEIKFNKLVHTIEGVVTKYGDFFITAGTWGACLSGTGDNEPQPRRVGIKLFSSIAGKYDALKHNNEQLIDHIEVSFCI